MMWNRMASGMLGCGIAVALLVLLSLSAAAHEQREVADGQYLMVVGFLAEPAFAGEQNGLDLRVTKPAVVDPAATEAATPAAAAEAERIPVEGLADTLQAEVIFGDQTMTLELRPRFRDPGAYAGDLFPSTPGDYTFHIFGTIEGVAIDERFTSQPEGGFGAVQDPAPLVFPKPAASTDGGAAVSAGTVGNFAGGVGALVMVAGGGLLLARRVANRRAVAGPRS